MCFHTLQNTNGLTCNEDKQMQSVGHALRWRGPEAPQGTPSSPLPRAPPPPRHTAMLRTWAREFNQHCRRLQGRQGSSLVSPTSVS